MDAEAPENAMDTSGNPEVAWWCKILTRLVASIAGVGKLTRHLTPRLNLELDFELDHANTKRLL